MEASHEQKDSSAPLITPSFSLLKPSMSALNLNLGVFLSLYLIPFALLIPAYIIVAVATSSGGNGSSAVGGVALAILVLFVIAIEVIFMPALYLTQIKSVRGETVGLKEMVKAGLPFVGRYILVSLMTATIVVVGLLLLIVPGIIWLRMFWFAPYHMLDKNLSPVEAMKQSRAASKPYKGSIYGIMGVFLLYGLISIIPLIGSLISSILQILYICAPAKRYDEINAAIGKHPTPAPAAETAS